MDIIFTQEKPEKAGLGPGDMEFWSSIGFLHAQVLCQVRIPLLTVPLFLWATGLSSSALGKMGQDSCSLSKSSIPKTSVSGLFYPIPRAVCVSVSVG